MEVTGVERIFRRSIENILYFECIGHIQKRVGSMLRKLKKIVPGLGKLGLNDSAIDKLQTHYGMSVRSNVGNLNAMKRRYMPHGATSALRRKIISISIVLKERIVGVHNKLTLRMAHQLVYRGRASSLK